MKSLMFQTWVREQCTAPFLLNKLSNFETHGTGENLPIGFMKCARLNLIASGENTLSS